MSAEEKLQEALHFAESAGLRYVYDSDPGIARRRHGKGFSYRDQNNKTVRNPYVLMRCRKLAVPPAWKEVWICAYENGHIQATGFDEKGRKQYRYHESWRTMRDQNKFANMLAFGQSLPTIRRKVSTALKLEGLPKEKVVAAVVRLLDRTGLRVGNEAYTTENETFGITTIRKKHLDLNGTVIELDFPGKGGKVWQGRLTDAKIAKVMAECGDLPGTRLFKWIDGKNETHAVGSGDVNAWLHEATGSSATAKDFRTWTACTLFLEEAMAQTQCRSGTALHLKPVLKKVSAQLGNTPAILQKSYVHPELIDLYRTGCLLDKQWDAGELEIPSGLRKCEALLLRWLQTKYN